MGIIGQFFNYVICVPLGYLLSFCYTIGRDYGVAIILFTLITRIFLFPLAIKQQKSSSEMLRMKPKLDKIQKMYAKDKTKLNEETMKLYQEEGYNPAGGCLPLLIQLPILWGLFTVVYNPLTYIARISSVQITKAFDVLKQFMTQKEIMDTAKREIHISEMIPKHQDLVSFLPQSALHLKLDFFGFDLGGVPDIKQISWLLLIPIFCYITSFGSSFLSMKLNPMQQATGSNQSTKSMNFSMIVFMPLMSTWFCFSVPAGVGFYWIITNLFMILQVIILNKFYNPYKLAEESEKRSVERKRTKSIRNGIPEEISAPVEEQPKEITETKQENQKKQGGVQNQKKKPVPHKNKSQVSKKDIKMQNRKKLADSRAKEINKENK